MGSTGKSSGGREMCDAQGLSEDDVGAFVTVRRDLGWETLGGVL